MDIFAHLGSRPSQSLQLKVTTLEVEVPLNHPYIRSKIAASSRSKQ